MVVRFGTAIRNILEDIVLWAVLALACVTLTIDYAFNTAITEWLI